MALRPKERVSLKINVDTADLDRRLDALAVKAAAAKRLTQEANGLRTKNLGTIKTINDEDRTVTVICSTSEVDRVGDIVIQDGIDLTAYKANPVVLFEHDRKVPIARAADIGVVAGKLTATVQFPPAGVSPKADEIYGLVKAEVINAVSIGFMPIDEEPVDPKKPWGGVTINRSELYEFSFVSVPAVRGALVTERSLEKALGQTKGLYDVARLACLLGELGALNENTIWEAGWEEDGSPVPGMIYDALQQLGAALVAMTQEEVSELLSDVGEDIAMVEVEATENSVVVVDDPEDDDEEMEMAKAARLRAVESRLKAADLAA